MFCEQCGTKIEDDSTFCHNCGYKIEQKKVKKAVTDNKKQISGTDENSNKGKLIGILAAVAIALVACIFGLNNRRISVDLNKYVSVSVEGYDTLGKADYRFDYNAFYEDYKNKIKMQTNNGKSVMVQDWLGENYFAVEMLREYFGGNLEQKTKLSNGDTITFTWHCEDDVIKELFNCRLKYSDISVQVSGLEEIQTFDPFEGVNIEVKGILPRVSISVTNNSNIEAINDIYFSPVANAALRNGEKITIQASVRGSEETFIEKYGMLPQPVEKQYGLNGYEEYVFTQKQLTKQHMEELQNLTYKELESESWSSNESIEDVEFLGTYIFSEKEPRNGSYEEFGSIYVVCKVKVNCSLDTTQGLINYPIEYFYYDCFEDVYLDLDGTLETTKAWGTGYGPFNQYEVDTGYYRGSGQEYRFHYMGYETLEELYEYITNIYDSDNYNCEDNIK